MDSKKKRIGLLRELLEKGKQLTGLSHKNQQYPQWIEQVKITLKEFFSDKSPEFINFDKHMRIYSYQREITEQENQQFYDQELASNLQYIQNLISGLEQETKIHQTFRFERFFQNFGHLSCVLWEKTVKAGVEGIVNSLKKN